MNPIDWPRQTPERMVRRTLHDKENLREFLTSALPTIASGFDVSAAEPLPLTFYGGDWRERELDMLLQVPYLPPNPPATASAQGTADAPIATLVYLMMEHQTNTDRLTPLRTHILSGAIWDRCLKAWRQLDTPRPKLELPPVIPLVLYTGATPWGSATKLHEVLTGAEELKQWVPNWGPVFWNLASRSVEQLLAGGAWMQFMAVVRAEDADTKEFERVFTEAVRHLANQRQTDNLRWFELLSIVLGYSLFRRTTQRERLQHIARSVVPDRAQEVDQMSMTIVESFRHQGHLENARQDIQDILEERFGKLPATLLQKLEETTDRERLREAHRQSWKINVLDDLKL